MFSEDKKLKFVEAMSNMLKIQQIAASGFSVEDSGGNINAKALGYVYGFIDGALQTIGQAMSDESIGPPLTLKILESLFPGNGFRYLEFLK